MKKVARSIHGAVNDEGVAHFHGGPVVRKISLILILSTIAVGPTVVGSSVLAGDDTKGVVDRALGYGCGAASQKACGKGASMCYERSVDDFRHLLPQTGRLNITGWFDLGFVGNTSSPASRYNGPYNAVDRSNELMLNQLYLISEIGLPCDGSLGVGGRLDMMYGEDFLLAESIGMEKRPNGDPHWNGEFYGLAIPQAYVEVGTERLSAKIGKFYSTIGYEGVMSPYNFFYSKAYSYQFAGPFTHSGGVATWKINNRWETHVGLVNGWDAVDRTSDRVNLLAGIKYATPCNGWWTSFAIITGDESNNLAGLLTETKSTNRTRYSWIVDLPITCRWGYVFHQWLGSQEEGTLAGHTAYWYGLDQYLYYTINDCWKAGIRFEWFRDEDGTRVGLNRLTNTNDPPYVGNFYSLSGGVNWRPTCNLTIRPELRWDWFDGKQARLPYGDGGKDNQLLLGCDVIWRF